MLKLGDERAPEGEEEALVAEAEVLRLESAFLRRYLGRVAPDALAAAEAEVAAGAASGERDARAAWGLLLTEKAELCTLELEVGGLLALSALGG